MVRENYVGDQTRENRIKQVHEDLKNTMIDTSLKNMQRKAAAKGIELTAQQIEGIKQKINQDWIALSQKDTQLNQDQQKIEIEKFSREIQANYPSLWKVVPMS